MILRQVNNTTTKPMETKKQTAVEWLWEQIDNTIPFQNIQVSQIFNGLLEQALAMEKEQIVDAVSGSLPTDDWCTEDRHIPGCKCEGFNEKHNRLFKRQ